MSLLWQRRGKSTSRLIPKLAYRPCVETLEDRLVPSGDAVLRWNAVALEAEKVDFSSDRRPEQMGPVRAARALAIVHAAIYDAVNAIDRTYTSYLTDVMAPPNTSMDAAIAAAAHDTLAAVFPAQTATFDQALTQDLAAIPDGPAADAGLSLGRFVANRILVARQTDGSQGDPAYTPGTAPGQWRPDPLHPTQQALSAGWGNVTPFALASASQFRVPPPPALNSPQYTAAYKEVKAYGGDGITTPTIRTPEQTEIGIFWGYDGSRDLGVPPRLYNQIVRTIAEQQGNTVVQNARLFALVNLAQADVGLAIWESKYVYNFWRPVAGIREGNSDGNPDTVGDPSWTPLGAPNDNGGGTNFTPGFPAYPSGHSGFGSTVFRTLANFYGTDNFHFTIGSDEFNGITRDQFGVVRPVVTRSYDSFSQAAEENAQSRIYLGIHWSFDKLSIGQGNQVADYLYQNFLESRLTVNERFVNQVYRDLVQRSAETAGMGYWSGLLDQGVSREQVVQGILDSVEHRTLVVQGLYDDLLHRTADPAGLNSMVNLLAKGSSAAQLEAFIMGSPEYFLNRGGGTNAGFLNALYQDGLNRAIDTTGLTVFGQGLAQGLLTRTQVAQIVCASTEFRQQQVQSVYERYLHRAGEQSGVDFWVGVLQEGAASDVLVASFLASAEYAGHL